MRASSANSRTPTDRAGLQLRPLNSSLAVLRLIVMPYLDSTMSHTCHGLNPLQRSLICPAISGFNL